MAESRTINKTVSINIVVEDDIINIYNCSECVFHGVEPSSGITCDEFAEQITGINCVEQKVHFSAVDYKGDIQNEHTN